MWYNRTEPERWRLEMGNKNPSSGTAEFRVESRDLRYNGGPELNVENSIQWNE